MKINGLIKKYCSLSEPAKASLWFVVSNIVTKGISFFTLPLFTRLMTKEQFGIISVYSSWEAIIVVLSTLTLWGGVFNVGMSKFKGREDELTSSFQGLGTLITMILFAVSCLGIGFLSRIMGISAFLIVLMYVEILVQIPYNLWGTRQKYLYKYKKLIITTIFTAVLNPLLAYILVINSEHKAEARIIGGIIVQLVIGVYFWIENIRNGKRLYSRDLWLYAWNFSVILIPYYLSLQVLGQSDRIMISKLCGEGYAGVYNVAYSFAMVLGLVTNGIIASLTPYIYQSMKSMEVKNLTQRTTAVVLFVAFVTIMIICVVPDIFLFLLPESYHDALYAIPPVTLGAFFMFIYPLFSTIEMYYEENSYITIGSMIAAAVNIVLNYIFINLYGFVAAGYTTLVCYIVLSVAHYYMMKRVQRKHNSNVMVYDIIKITVICVCTTVFGLVILSLYKQAYVRWVIFTCIAGALIYNRKKLKKTVSLLLK